ncbi:MAG TPA: pirin family protein [Methylomirabilota bacterium]|nr:pirin family protein [Methylomirabilota bacterium]
MITRRAAADRGHFEFDWLDTSHSFSFGEYYDPRHMGFRALRVINEDRVQPGRGFPTHGHRDMEIISYVLAGALQHRDSLGTGSVILPGEVQRMSAGTGVTHSEFNPSPTELAHFLQIWIVPDQRGYEPSYEQRTIADADKRGVLRLIAGPRGGGTAVRVHQDVRLYSGLLERDQEVVYELHEERHAWIQVARGSLTLNGRPLWQGDGAAVSAEAALRLIGLESTEVLVFDLS